MFIKAIEYHLEYLRAIQKNINGSGDYRGTNHESCTMGKWLHGDGIKDVKKFGKEAEKLIEQLFEPHEEFHRVCKDSIKAFNENDYLLAKRSLTEMIFLSDKLTKILLELNKIATES